MSDIDVVLGVHGLGRDVGWKLVRVGESCGDVGQADGTADEVDEADLGCPPGRGLEERTHAVGVVEVIHVRHETPAQVETRRTRRRRFRLHPRV